MPKEPLISIVEDDQFLRESMRRLMRSLGYTVAVFPSAADFLASPRRDETACLIADVHMPACGPAPLGPFTGLPAERPRIEGQPGGRALRRHGRRGSCHEVIGVDDDRGVPAGFADSGLHLA